MRLSLTSTISRKIATWQTKPTRNPKVHKLHDKKAYIWNLWRWIKPNL